MPIRRPLAVAAFAAAVLAAPALAQQSTFDLPGAATPAPPRPDIAGVTYIDVWSNAHTEGPVRYDTDPPAGGPHNPVWQSCGVYDAAPPAERVVHSLEHGAVWLTYRDDLPKADREMLAKLADGNDWVLVSPWPDLTHPLVATAWGAQLALDSATDPRLEAFVDFYANSPDGPEYGAPCLGGADATTPIEAPVNATPMANPRATPQP